MTKKAARAAKTDTTDGTLQHLSEINAKDKEIASLKKALKGVKPQDSPKKLEAQVKSLEAQLQKAQGEIKALKDSAPRASPAAASSDAADVRRPAPCASARPCVSALASACLTLYC